MQARWDDVVFLALCGVSFVILWWQSAKLHSPRLGTWLWELFRRVRTLSRKMWVFSAETLKAQEVEFIDEHPLDFSVFFPWLVRLLLLILYLLILLTWIISSMNGGS